MAGLIVVDHDTVWKGAGWAFRAVIEAIAEELVSTESEQKIITSLTTERHIDFVDLQKMAPTERLLFWKAAQRAYARQLRTGPIDWHDPSFFADWLEHFRTLMRLGRTARRQAEKHSHSR